MLRPGFQSEAAAGFGVVAFFGGAPREGSLESAVSEPSTRGGIQGAHHGRISRRGRTVGAVRALDRRELARRIRARHVILENHEKLLDDAVALQRRQQLPIHVHWSLRLLERTWQ